MSAKKAKYGIIPGFNNTLISYIFSCSYKINFLESMFVLFQPVELLSVSLQEYEATFSR